MRIGIYILSHNLCHTCRPVQWLTYQLREPQVGDDIVKSSVATIAPTPSSSLCETHTLQALDLSIAYTLHQLAMCAQASGRPDEAEPLFSQALDIQARIKLMREDAHVAARVVEVERFSDVRSAGRLTEAGL